MKPLSKAFCHMLTDTVGRYEERDAGMAWFNPMMVAQASWWGTQVIEFLDGSICTCLFIEAEHYDSLRDYIEKRKLPELLYEVLEENLNKSRDEIREKREQKEEKEQREMEVLTHEDA